MGNINHEEGISKNNKMLLLSAGAVYVVITTCIKRHSYNTTKKNTKLLSGILHIIRKNKYY